VLSALYLTLADKSLHTQDLVEFKHEVNMALFFGTLFTLYQIEEYNNTVVSLDEGVYGSTLYAITGLHGAHVIIGALLISVGASEALKKSTSKLSFVFAAWYWHFVDFVWVFVFTYLY
jgi:cytochrome c oxidase subunit 3